MKKLVPNSISGLFGKIKTYTDKALELPGVIQGTTDQVIVNFNEVVASQRLKQQKIARAFSGISLEGLEKSLKFADIPIIGDILGDTFVVVSAAGVGLQISVAAIETLTIVLGIDRETLQKIKQEKSYENANIILGELITYLAAYNEDTLDSEGKLLVSDKCNDLLTNMNLSIIHQRSKLEKSTLNESDKEIQYASLDSLKSSIDTYQDFVFTNLKEKNPKVTVTLGQLLLIKELYIIA